MSNKGSASSLLLGLGVSALFSISFLFYHFFWKTTKPAILPAPSSSSSSSSPPTPPSSSSPTPPPSSSPSEKKEPSSAVPPPTTSSTSSSSVVIDEEEDDEEEDDEEGKLALKASYDDALRMAKKLLSGEKYFKAAEKFTEAISLAGELGGSASSDVTTLYNNRSAMYEKCGELSLSLGDISVVMAMEPLHLKARVRRARIFEVQHKVKESCIDYMVGVFTEMSRGQQASYQDKIEALVKLQSVSEADAVVQAIRESGNRELPSRSHCRNYFETFASYHKWRDMYVTAGVDRESLVQAVGSAGGENFSAEMEEATRDELLQRLHAVHCLVCHDIAVGAFSKAFALAGNVCAFLESHSEMLARAGVALRTVAADLFSIHGTYFHLSANFKKAKECFLHSLDSLPLPAGYEAALRLASVHLEVDTVADASKVYDSVVSSFSAENDSDQAWLCIHRMSEWVTRNGEGQFRPQALVNATALITEALDLTKAHGSDVVQKSCRLMALLKMVQLLSQTKMQMGMQPDNDDMARQKECIEEALRLFPTHDTVQMLRADMMSQDGNFDDALKLCEEMIHDGADGGDDPIRLVIKANVFCQKGMTKYAEAQQFQNQGLAVEAETLLKEGQTIYAEAITLDPKCVEAMVQLAQLKSMMGQGEVDETLSLCNKALACARSRDEALDILQLKLMTDNRLAAIKEMQAHGVQNLGGV